MSVTRNVAKYVKDMGINLSELSRKSGVAYGSLYASLADSKRERELRGEELTSICAVLHVNPMDFADTKKPTLNDMRIEHGLKPIPEGNVVLTPKE